MDNNNIQITVSFPKKIEIDTDEMVSVPTILPRKTSTIAPRIVTELSEVDKVVQAYYLHHISSRLQISVGTLVRFGTVSGRTSRLIGQNYLVEEETAFKTDRSVLLRFPGVKGYHLSAATDTWTLTHGPISSKYVSTTKKFKREVEAHLLRTDSFQGVGQTLLGKLLKEI